VAWSVKRGAYGADDLEFVLALGGNPLVVHEVFVLPIKPTYYFGEVLSGRVADH
jgi:hypothetical protein